MTLSMLAPATAKQIAATLPIRALPMGAVGMRDILSHDGLLVVSHERCLTFVQPVM